jgi:hypothetical protein
MSSRISLDDECSKCGVTLRRQALQAMMIDAGAQTLDPALCPEGGDHDFVGREKVGREKVGREKKSEVK